MKNLLEIESNIKNLEIAIQLAISEIDGKIHNA